MNTESLAMVGLLGELEANNMLDVKQWTDYDMSTTAVQVRELWQILKALGYDMFHLESEAFDIYAAAVDHPETVNNPGYFCEEYNEDLSESAQWLLTERLIPELDALIDGVSFGSDFVFRKINQPS